MTRTFCRRNLLLLLLLLLSLCSCSPQLQAYQQPKRVQDFQFTDQDGKRFGLSDLRGKVWMANFIFTNCRTVCPPMTANMAKLQQRAKKEGIAIHFVSFSVDPEKDSPETLKKYAQKFDADFSNWHFLTGYSEEEIARLAKFSFGTLVDQDENSGQVVHSTQFYLIDSSGRIVKSFQGAPDFNTEQVLKAIKDLENR